ncbi:hypothetical protein SAMN04488029_2880 [Reichenbachiella faecimaris]|uniref:Phytanoyl-CoA dioxygenase (PhyH) n=1 Tax=Reichenbachiella faecimaris TaxID=692418 RepID=A0A1W2GIC7_REIFA|nr:hypothetical protein [Reichenbachiella faecimaris]SMD36405.1 hypothetical protein SAMN04488029_2880 [Reichenbachiella faecimaris]
MNITVGQDQYEYSVEGESIIAKQDRLIDREDDLTKTTTWHRQGYTVQNLFDNSTYHSFIQVLTGILLNKFLESGIHLDPNKISEYHTRVENYEQHLAIVDKTKLIQGYELDPYFEKLEKAVSEICGIPVYSIKPMNGERVFHFRIIRPNRKDFNPLHKDGWMEELKDCINLYIPICGSNEKSSLILAEGSHLLNEDTFVRTKAGAKMNDVQFNVPGLIDSKESLNFVRPNPGSNEILVFSPYLIHGGSLNLNTNQTRISLEMRFWRKP